MTTTTYTHTNHSNPFLSRTSSARITPLAMASSSSSYASSSHPHTQPPGKPPIVWTIAGSDSGGGAGIQADLLAFHALGCHGCSAITALTAQNSHEVRAVQTSSLPQLRATLEALGDDFPPRAVKLGMLATGEVSVMEGMEGGVLNKATGSGADRHPYHLTINR